MLVSGARFVGMAAVGAAKKLPKWEPLQLSWPSRNTQWNGRFLENAQSQKGDENLMLDNFRRVIFFRTGLFFGKVSHTYHPQLCHTHTHIDLGVSQSQAENKETNN